MSQPKTGGAVRKPVTVFFTMAHTPQGVKRVGRAYSSKATASDWVPFVRGAWHCRVTVRKLVVSFTAGGQIDAKTIRRLDREFNMNAEGMQGDCQWVTRQKFNGPRPQ